MTVRQSASASAAQRLVAIAVTATLAVASLLVSAPQAEAAGTRVISGTFTLPSSGFSSWWADGVGATLYTEDGGYYKEVTLDTTAKTFSATALDPGRYRLKFESYYFCGATGCGSSNLGTGMYGGGDGTLIDVTAANATGLTYAWPVGRTISGTVSLAAGAPEAWKDSLYASVSFPGPAGCECGSGATFKADPETGEYTITGLAPGSYKISFVGEDDGVISPTVNLVTEYYGGSYTWEGATEVVVAGANVTGIDATLEVGRTISGTVTLPGGVDPVAKKAINVYAEGANGARGTGHVDQTTGAYTVYGLAPSTYTLEFDANNYYSGDEIMYTPLASVYYGGSFTAAGSTTVDVTSAMSATGRDQLMVVGRTISGTVALGDGIEPLWLSALSAYAESGNTFRSARIDPSTGNYTIQGLAPGAYTVSFDGNSLRDGSEYIYDDFADEYYNNQRSPYTANLVNVSSANVTNINATMDLQVGNRDYWIAPVPTVTGTGAVGNTLTAQTGTWEPYATTFTYQWKRNGANIGGATQKTYAVTQADAGATLTVAVTPSRVGYNPVTMTSAGTSVALTAFTTAPTPTISGTPTVNSTLTAMPGTWSPSATLSYQWKRNGSAIPSATASTYLLVAADAGAAITVTVTGAASGYATTSKTSASVTGAAAEFASAPSPSISGTIQVGSTLTGSVAPWSPVATFAYQWQRNGEAIPGADATTYTLVPADGGQYITFKVTGSATGYHSITRVSGAVTPTGQLFTDTPSPSVSGVFKVGSTVTAVTSAWTPVADFNYEWLRDGEAIDDAYDGTYTLKAADYGHTIAVRVTGRLEGYERHEETSDASTVASGTFSAATTPTISGSTYLGATLTATVGTWSPTPSATTYQWYRSGSAISGAKSKTYKLTTSDSGKKITVKVTAAATGYATTSKTSSSLTLAKFFTKYPTPAITGTVKVGYTVSVSKGTWSPAPTSYSYQWYRAGVAISGANKSTYKLISTDGGKALTVRVTAKRSGYASTPRTSSAKTVANASFSKAPTPKISGTAKVGSTLTASRYTWSPAPTTFTYQWYRSGSAISGANKSTYKLTTSERGKTITVKVTAKRTGYATTSRTSAKTATVK